MRCLVYFLFSVTAVSAEAADIYGSIALNGAAHTAGAEPASPKHGVQLLLNADSYWGDIAIVAKGRARWNEAYADSAYGEYAKDAYRHSADWRELYAELPVQDWMVSLGWQQVVWGRADNLRVIDRVNPLDYREFVLPDLSEYRKPSLMVKGERYLGDWSLQVIYIPFFEENDLAVQGSEFEYQLFDEQTTAFYQINESQLPARNFKNSEWGANLSKSFQGVDLSLVALYSWSDDAVYQQSYSWVQDQMSGAYLTPQYHRQTLLGTSAALTLGSGFVARTELALSLDQTYSNASMDLTGELPERDTLQFLLGLDYLWRDWIFSAQLQDHHIDQWDETVLANKHEPLATFSATGQSLAGKLESRLVYARYVDEANDQLLQLKLTWKPTDSWALSAGGDAMTGQALGVFGQFAQKDRIWAEAKYYF